MFVVCNLTLGRTLAEGLPKIVLIVGVPHFLVEFTHAKAALYIDQYRT